MGTVSCPLWDVQPRTQICSPGHSATSALRPGDVSERRHSGPGSLTERRRPHLCEDEILDVVTPAWQGYCHKSKQVLDSVNVG